MTDVPLLEERIGRTTIPESSDRRIRDWQRYLELRDGPGLCDELPEVVFSSKAIGEGPLRSLDTASLLTLSDLEWDLARRCEIRAAGQNVSLSAFVRAASTYSA